MPKIFLKPNSPEFADGRENKRLPRQRCCDMPECEAAGEYRAPKDRGLNEYYWFCLQHVQDYNKAWNYFSGMSMADVENYINTATVWDRPTRRYDSMAGVTEKLHQKAWQTYHFTEQEAPRERAQAGGPIPPSRQTPEFEALALLGLEPPVTLLEIKTKYKVLAKKYHPDHNGHNPDDVELLKKINMAYTILKMAYQKFETLPERSS
jgi:hypothetical protein